MKLQKRLAAYVLDCGTNRVRFDEAKLTEIKEAITKADMARLVKNGVVYKAHDTGCSRVRAEKRRLQRQKGRRKGAGTRSGTRQTKKKCG